MNEITDQAATRADLQSAAEGALAQAQRDLDSLSRELHQVHNQMGKQLEEVRADRTRLADTPLGAQLVACSGRSRACLPSRTHKVCCKPRECSASAPA
jgi:hypothetical protein